MDRSQEFIRTSWIGIVVKLILGQYVKRKGEQLKSDMRYSL